jgi:hypothetical protein
VFYVLLPLRTGLTVTWRFAFPYCGPTYRRRSELWKHFSTLIPLYSGCPLLVCYPTRRICFRSIVFSHGIDLPIRNTSTSRPYNPGHQIGAPNRIPGTQLNGSEELVEFGTQYDPLMYRTSLGYLSGNLISWVEVLRRHPFWELVREIVIVSGNDGSRRFSGMTVLNWKPADESLEQARNK